MTNYLLLVQKKNYFYELVVILLLCIRACRNILKPIILILLVRIISSKLFTSLFLTLQYFVSFFQPVSYYSKKNGFSWTVCLDYFLFNETNYSSIKSRNRVYICILQKVKTHRSGFRWIGVAYVFSRWVFILLWTVVADGSW